MTTTTAIRETRPDATRQQGQRSTIIGVLALTVVLALIALFGPNLTASTLGMDMTMSMTHYMELLAIRQPWNLLIFMALPVILAETLAITELAILFQRDATPAWVRTTSRVAGLIAGPVMFAIFLHVMVNAAIPLTTAGAWRGPADLIAVGFYLTAAVPLVGITLVELGFIGANATSALKWHAIFIAFFLVVAHIAMIFGMLDPNVLGYLMVHPH